eukprot:366512-Chlamydomonas_euryale.AAC.11
MLRIPAGIKQRLRVMKCEPHSNTVGSGRHTLTPAGRLSSGGFSCADSMAESTTARIIMATIPKARITIARKPTSRKRMERILMGTAPSSQVRMYSSGHRLYLNPTTSTFTHPVTVSTSDQTNTDSTSTQSTLSRNARIHAHKEERRAHTA